MLPRKELQRKPVVWQAGGGSVQTAACKMPFGMLKLKQLREDTIRGFTPAAPLKLRVRHGDNTSLCTIRGFTPAARRTAPARKEYKAALDDFDWAKRRYAAQRHAAANYGFYTERNYWLVALAIAIPCGIVLPVAGFFVIIPILFYITPIWERTHEKSSAAFDNTHTAPAFNHAEPAQNYIPDPIVSLHPDCSSPSLFGIGYNRNFILRRDDFTCQSCGCRFPSIDLEVHHVLPRAQHGSDSIRNLISLCKQCHIKEDWFNHIHKHNRQLIFQKHTEEFIRRYRRIPRRRS